MSKLWNKKPIAVLQAEAADLATQELMAHGSVPLKRTLSAMSLMALGIGNIIGAGRKTSGRLPSAVSRPSRPAWYARR